MPNLRDLRERVLGPSGEWRAAQPAIDLRVIEVVYPEGVDHDGVDHDPGYDPGYVDHDGDPGYVPPGFDRGVAGRPRGYRDGSRWERRIQRRRARTLAILTFVVGVLVGIAIEALRGDDPQAQQTQTAAANPPGPPTQQTASDGSTLRPFDQVHVLSVNGESGVAGQATGMGNRLRAAGYTAIDATSGPPVEQTVVYSWPGYEGECTRVADFVAKSRNEAVRTGLLDGSVTNTVPGASDAHCVVVIGPPQATTVTFETGPSVASVS